MHLVIFADVTCSSLSSPENGYINFASDMIPPYDFQTNATYSCNTPYGLSRGNNVRTCISSSAGSGEWSGVAPFCGGNFSLVF